MATITRCHCQKWPRWVKISIWAIGIISLSALALKETIPMVNEYKDDNSNVITQVFVVRNRSIRRPILAVCLPYYSTALSNIRNWVSNIDMNQMFPGSNYAISPIPVEYTEMKKHSWDVWDLNNHPDPHMGRFGEAVTKIIKRLKADGNGFPTLTLNRSSDFHWNQPIIDAVWYYFAYMISIDKDMKNDAAMLNFTLIGQIPKRAMDELFERVLMSTLGYIPTDAMTITREHNLCFQLDSDSTKGASSMGGSSIGYEYFFKSTGKEIVKVYDDPRIIYTQPPFGASDQPLYETNINVTTTVVGTEYVALAYAVDWKFVEDRTGKIKSCSKDITSEICFAERRSLFIMEHCKCEPFAYRFLTPNNYLPYCNPWHYDETCREKVMEKDEEINRYCNEQCEHTQFKWKVRSSISQVNLGARSFYISIDHSWSTIAPYVEYTAVDKTTSQQLISQLGGSISLYLGVSGLSIAAVIVVAIDRFTKRYRGRSTNYNSGDAWTLLWMKNYWRIMAGQRGNGEDSLKIIREELAQLKAEQQWMRNEIIHMDHEQTKSL